MENATGSDKQDALKSYAERLKDKLDNLSLTVVAPTKVSSVYNRHIKQHLQCLRSLRIENPAIHDEIIQNNPEYKQLSEQFIDWAQPKKKSQVRLTPEKIFQELQGYLNNPSDKDFFTEEFTEEKYTLKGIKGLQASTPYLFQDRRRKLPAASSPVPEEESAQTSHFPHKKFRRDLFKKNQTQTNTLRAPPLSASARIFECNP